MHVRKIKWQQAYNYDYSYVAMYTYPNIQTHIHTMDYIILCNFDTFNSDTSVPTALREISWIIGVNLSEPHHVGSTVKSVLLLACLLACLFA